MNVLDFAMKMELDGKAYYETLADRCQEPGLSNIFTRLAEDEQKHYETFQTLKAGAGAAIMADTNVVEAAKNVFTELPRKSETLKGLEKDLEAYQHAMKIEAESFRFYENAAAKEPDACVKKLLLQIAQEEHMHFTVMENIYQFMNAPNQYLAWAEFSNLEEFRQFGRDIDV